MSKSTEGDDSTKDSVDSDPRLDELFKTLINIERDQINSQLSHADTNDLKAIGILGTVVAIVIASFAIKSVSVTHSFKWWWIPLMGFLPSVLALVLPMRGSGWTNRRSFSAGPRVPNFLDELRSRSSRGEMVNLQSGLILILQSLEASRQQNDKLLLSEAKQIRAGLWFFLIAAIVVFSLYAWKLT